MGKKENKSPNRKREYKSIQKREMKVKMEKGNKSQNRIWKLNEQK